MTQSEAAIVDPDRLAAAAIAAVPDWRASTVTCRDVSAPVMSPMHRGIDSLCFAVDADMGAFFLKIAHPECRDGIDIQTSFAAAARAAAAGHAPKPIFALPEHFAIVFERLDETWKSATIGELGQAGTMAAVIAAKKALHASQRFGRAWTIFDAVRTIFLKATEIQAVDERASIWMLDAIREIEKAFQAAGSDAAPCHADGLASNVMIGAAGQVCLVDFDMACDTDPLYELGALLNEAYVFEDEMCVALDMYEGQVRRATLDRCRLYAVVDDFYWSLWASVMHAASARRGIEFMKYAQWRMLRGEMAVLSPDFERKLRTI
jgi:hypothetical protein